MTLEDVVRSEWGKVVAALTRRFGDLTLAEDCAQDACSRAMTAWAHGFPERPGAWLQRVAYNRALDVIRARRDLEPLPEYAAIHDAAAFDSARFEDDRLELMMMCAHPALAAEAQLALMLRCVAGLTTAQIAAAFLTNESTMAQRLVRARRKIQRATIDFTVAANDIPSRLECVRTAIYLLLTEGHSATGGDATVRRELIDEALYLARTLYRLAPRETESAGLYALVLIHSARMPARTGSDGRLVRLSEQDPTRFHTAAIDEALPILHQALARRRPGRYQIEAAISALHTHGAIDGQTDWKQIASLYEHLLRVAPSPVVEINRALAVANAGDIEAALGIFSALLLIPSIRNYAPLYAGYAEVLERAERGAEARAHWLRALAAADNPAYREQIERRIAQPAPYDVARMRSTASNA